MEQVFIEIIAKGAKSNTYKFALAKFLLDYARSKKVITNYEISYRKIAEKFLEYYWFQECKYKFKQDFNKDKMPVVISLIQKYCGTEYIPDTYEKYFKNRKDVENQLITEIESKCFKDVIPRFQPATNNIFYTHAHQISANGRKFIAPAKDQKYIVLSCQAITFFRENYEVLSKVLTLEWAKFLEKTNFTPRLILKIELMKDPKRGSLTKYKNALLEMDSKCFYCNTPLANKQIHIDHFIPWSYIYENAIWNLVQACSKCNLIKSDSLAPEQCINRIVNRNEKFGLTQWNSDINEYYENCHKAGFMIVQDEKLECSS